MQHDSNFFSKLLDKLDGGYLIFNATDKLQSDFQIDSVSKGFEKLTGILSQELTNKNIATLCNLLHIEPSAWKEAFKTTIENDEEYVFEHFVVSLNKTLLIRVVSPQENLFFAHLSDVSPRVEARKRLVANRRMLENLLGNLSGMAYRCSYNEPRTMSFVSEGALELTGYSASTFTTSEDRLPFTDIVLPDDKAKIHDAIKNAENSKKFTIAYKIRTAEGNIKSVLDRGTIIYEENQPIAIEGFISDVTDFVQTQNKLRDSEERFRAMLDSSNVGMGLINTEGKWVITNKIMHDLSGYTKEEMHNLTMEHISHPDDLEISRPHINDVITGEKPSGRYVKRYVMRDGRIVWLDVFISSVRDVEGKISGIAGTAIDVTDRILAEKRAREHERHLAAILDVYTLSHASIKEITDFALERAVEITESKMGYLAFYDENTRELNMYSWSQSVMEICQIENPRSVYPIDTTGIWGEAIRQRQPIIENDYQSPNPLKRGLPKGHVQISRHMNVPIFDGDRIVALAGVGNKADPYDENDIRHITLLVNAMWDMVSRKKAEEALRESEHKLSSIFRATPVGIGMTINRVILEANDMLCSMTGFSREEMIGKNARFLYDTADDFEFVGREKYRQIELSGIGTVETRWKRKDGKIIDVLLSSSPIGTQDQSRGITFSALDITERKRAAEALSHQHRFLQQIIDTHPHYIYVKNIFGHFTLVNDAMAKALGSTKDAILDKTEAQVWNNDPDALARDIEDVEIICARKIRILPERYFIGKNGVGKWLVTVKTPIIDENNKCNSVLVVSNDITERKKIEQTLNDFNRQLTDILTSISDAFFAVSSDLKIKYFNRAAEKMLGKESHNVLGRNLLEAFPEATGSFFEMRYSQALHSKTPDAFETYFAQQPLNGWFDVRIYPQRDGFSIYLQEITARKSAEHALAEYRQKLEAILAHLPELLWFKDKDGIFLMVNLAFARSCGYNSIYEIIGRTDFDIWPHDLAQKYVEDDRAILLDGKQRLIEEHIFQKGEYRWFETFKSPFFDSDGNITGTVGSARDITARKAAEEHRIMLERQIQHAQKLESLGVLAGGIAHDFNNLLTAILGNLDLALADLSPLSPVRENIISAEHASRRAADLAKQMLAYSGKGRFVLQKIDLKELVEEMAHILQVSISKKVVLRFNFAQNLPPVEADVSQIRQVVMNLIVNASEAIGDRSGYISISTGAIDCDSTYLSETWLDEKLPAGLYVYLEVADTGCGMDNTIMGKIFDPFYTTKFTGRGLGLAAVLGIIRGHRGAIKLYSEKNKGTTFKVLFPAAKGFSRELETESTNTDNLLFSGTILLAEDEETVRSLGKVMLERLGFKVLVAADGRQAVEIFRANMNIIDCVLLDLTMPHLDGEEAFRELRLLKPDVRVLMCSGYNEQDVTQRFIGKGLAGFIAKPYRLATLKQKLREVLETDYEKGCPEN